jgi:hypothetical protein
MHSCFLAVLGSALLVMSAASAGAESLSGLDFTDTERDVTAKMALARKAFPLNDETVSQRLAAAVRNPMRNEEQNGLRFVLYSHGPAGFLWALNRLIESDSVNVRYNILTTLVFLEYRETYVVYLCYIADMRDLPKMPVEFRGPKWEPMLPPPPGCGPVRVCDVAARCFCNKLLWRGQLPRVLKGKMGFGEDSLIRSRDHNISLIRDWWAKEGERYITATRPSVVEVLLKEAEERSKLQVERQAPQKVEGGKQEQKPSKQAEPKAPQAPAPKAKE